MAYDYKENWGNSSDDSQSDDGLFSSSAQRIFTIVCDTVEEANDEKGVLAGLPAISSSHPRLGVAFVLKDRSLSRTSPVMWEATLSYRTRPQQTGSGGGGEIEYTSFPWDEPALITFGTAQNTMLIDEDANGDALRTLAGQRVETSKTHADLTLSIKKAFLYFFPSEFFTYLNHVNRTQFLGFVGGVLKCTGITATPNRIEDVNYYDVVVNMVARVHGEDSKYYLYNDLGYQWGWGRFSSGTQFYTPESVDAGNPVARQHDDNRTVFHDFLGREVVAGEEPDFQIDPIYPTAEFSEMNLF